MIETERLKIIPLNYEQVLKYLNEDNSLEKELNLNETNRTVSKPVRDD